MTRRKKADYERLLIESEETLRAWLAANHTQDEGVWLVLFKKHCGERYVAWTAVVRQLLCFGWIDSQVNRLDEDRIERLIAPRRKGSTWSALNKQHVAELTSEGLMTPAGQARIDAAMRDGSWVFLDDIDALIVPADLAAQLASAQVGAWEASSRASRKLALYQVKSAKRAATRSRRIATIRERLSRGEPPA